jgi:hypothetical protein
VTEAPKKRRDWGESATLILALVLSFGLPNRYTLGGPILTFVLAIGAAIACGLSVVSTFIGSRTGVRWVMKGAAALLLVGLAASMSKILYLVVYRASEIQGIRLLESALMIWVSNVIIFAVIYHWIGERDFLFPRADGEAVKPMHFLDYFFLSFTTSTAFSPTDTAPLTTRARMFMMTESAISLLTIAVAAARAVNILS